MTKPRIRTISDAVLADTLLEMKEDFGTWDMDPDVLRLTQKGLDTLSGKMVRGVREIHLRVGKDGLEAHEPLKRIFQATAALVRREPDFKAWQVYDRLRRIAPKREPARKYAF